MSNLGDEMVVAGAMSGYLALARVLWTDNMKVLAILQGLFAVILFVRCIAGQFN